MTSRTLIEPVKLLYRGFDADSHRMDANLLGQSLSGLGRLYNSVGHFYFHGQIKRPRNSEVRVQVGPPEPGSIFYLIYMVMMHGSLPMYPELLFEMAEMAVPAIIKAMISKKTGQDENLEKALEIIDSQNARYHEMVRANQENDMRTRERQLELIEKLALQNRSAMADMAAPVGKTVADMMQLPAHDGPITIDAPVAEALRSPSKITVGEATQIVGTITALDTVSGTFKLEEANSGKEYRGKITDPAIAVPQNIYSHALDTKERVLVSAKPTLTENGEVHKLFVSDARKVDS